MKDVRYTYIYIYISWIFDSIGFKNFNITCLIFNLRFLDKKTDK